MPEVKHTGQPSIAAPASVQNPEPQTLEQKAAAVASVVTDKNIKPEDLENAIISVLRKQKAAAVEAAKPKEPDWSQLTEAQAMTQDVYIPVIEHEVPDYMNMRLKDPEYEVVWASKDQRRLGQLMAMGYSFLEKNDVHPDFVLPLLFDSEGRYTYVDVVAMKVHKRILYGKRRKALQVSLNQLSNRRRPPRVRIKDSYDLTEPVPDQNVLGQGSYLYSDIV
jgi:hypothetical protein